MNKDGLPSRASVLRMELYLEVLEQMEREGRLQVTSADIGNALAISPANVRQDLLGLGSAGRPKVGYDVSHLAHMLRLLFDINRTKKACLVGLGNLGRALAGSEIWARAGYQVATIFDNNPDVVGTFFNSLRVRNVTEFFGSVKAEGIEMGVITVPPSQAQAVADLMVSAGVRSIWNFAPVKIAVPDGVVVENQFLAWGLITLSYRAAASRKERVCIPLPTDEVMPNRA